jgi:tetratricopeptide (TPR) repeat protein
MSATLAHALGLDRDEFAPLRLLGECAYQWCFRGELDRAEAIFRALQHAASNDPLPWLGQAEVLSARRRFEEAAESAAQARRRKHIDASTMVFAYVLEADIWTCAGETSRARAALDKALQLDANHPSVLAVEHNLDLLSQALDARNDSTGGSIS